jgi:hypothetical protein
MLIAITGSLQAALLVLIREKALKQIINGIAGAEMGAI